MEDAERFRLLGKYRTPRFRIGQKVFCEIRGDVTICGINDAPILWPLCKRGRGSPSLVVYKDLLKALHRESNLAVAHWWGIAVVTVSRWRKLLGVDRATDGTSRLHLLNIEEIGEGMRARSILKARDPERCRKIAEVCRDNRCNNARRENARTLPFLASRPLWNMNYCPRHWTADLIP